MNVVYKFILSTLLPVAAHAATLPGTLTYEGVLTDTSTGNAVDLSNSGSGTSISYYILGGTSCVLYAESAIASSSVGAVMQILGTGSTSRGVATSIPSYFNSSSPGGLAGVQYSDLTTACNVMPTDVRFIRIAVPSKSIVADISVSAVPYALAASDAKSMDGYDSAHVLKLATGVSTTGSELNSSSWTELLALIGGTSSQYVKGSAAVFTAAPQWSGVPSGNNDLTNKSYVDAQVAAGLPNVGTPGTYAKVTTDSKGRVTAGAALLAADIPSHDASKITSGVISIANGGTNSGSALTGGAGSKVMVSTASSIVEGPAHQASNVPNTFVVRDGSGGITGGLGTFSGLTVPSGGTVQLYGATSGSVGVGAPSVVTSYNMTLPSSAGASGQVLSTNGAGILSWVNSGSQWTNVASDIYFNTGKVGIGTSSPTSILDLNDGTGNGPGIKISNAGTPRIQFYNSLGPSTWQLMNGWGTGVNDDFAISSGTTGTANVGNAILYMRPTGNVGIGNTTPAASLHIRAGTTAASSAPIKLSSGPLMTTPEAGAIEFDGSNFFTTNNAPVRRAIANKAELISIASGPTYAVSPNDNGNILARTDSSGAGGSFVDISGLPIQGEVTIIHNDSVNGLNLSVQIYDSTASAKLSGQFIDNSAKPGGGNYQYLLAYSGSIKLRKVASGQWIILSRSGQAGIYGCPANMIQIGSGEAHTFCIQNASTSGTYFTISNTCNLNHLKFCSVEQVVEACQVNGAIGITWPNPVALNSPSTGGMLSLSTGFTCNTGASGLSFSAPTTTGNGFCCSQ